MFSSLRFKNSQLHLTALLISVSACAMIQPQDAEPRELKPMAREITKEATKKAFFLGPVKRDLDDRRWIKAEQDCPFGEWLYISQIPTNTFELGISWQVTQGGLRGMGSLYSSYRCIPR